MSCLRSNHVKLGIPRMTWYNTKGFTLHLVDVTKHFSGNTYNIIERKHRTIWQKTFEVEKKRMIYYF
jgi:hypothetical protein